MADHLVPEAILDYLTPGAILALASYAFALSLALNVALRSKWLFLPKATNKKADLVAPATTTAEPEKAARARSLGLIERHIGGCWLRCLPGAAEQLDSTESSRSIAPGTGTLAAISSVGFEDSLLPELTFAERQELMTGTMVVRRTPRADGGVDCLAAQRIRAPAEMTWSRLTAFGEWNQMVDFCTGCEEYERTGTAHQAQVKTRVTLGVPFMSVVAYMDNYEVSRATGRVSWRLDATKRSDCVRHEGFYCVRPDPSDPAACTIYYTAAVKVASWCPIWVENFINERGLPMAVGWITREAERRAMQLHNGSR